MPRILTRLRIDEVSAVDKGAGDGVKIVLMKRAYPKRCGKSFAEIMAEADRGAADDRAPVSDHHASKVADLLVEAGKYPHRPAALDHLLHTSRGQALLTRMHKKEAPMPTLESIMKDFGPVALCKHIADTGHSPVGEHELVAALTTAAVGLHPELSPASAFAKLYAEESVWRACAIAKAVEVANVQPMQVTGEDTRDLSDESEAIAHLKELGRQKWPTATEAQQFANALTDPKNAALAARAHVRPSPTTAYPWPR